MKKWGIWLLTALLADGGAAQVRAAEITPAPAEGAVYVEEVKELEPDPASNYQYWYMVGDDIFIRSGDLDYLLTYEGELVDGIGYQDIQPADYSFEPEAFAAVSQNTAELNSYAIADSCTGELLSDFAYAKIWAASENWVIGLVGSFTENSDTADFWALNYDACVLERADVYYQGVKVGELPPESAKNLYMIYLVDDYLITPAVEQGYYTVYDAAFNVVNTLQSWEISWDGSWWPGSEYYTDENGIYRHVSGEVLFVPGSPLENEDLDRPYLPLDVDMTQIIDVHGNTVAQLPYEVQEIGPFMDGYAMFRGYTDEGLYCGVLDENFQVVVEPVYDTIGGYFGNETFVAGYCQVIRDDMVNFVNLQGEETLPEGYSYWDTTSTSGLLATVQTEEGSRLISAVKGMTEEIYLQLNDYGGFACPVLAAQNQEGLWGVIDYNGEVVIPFEIDDPWDITMSSDGHRVMVEGDEATQLYLLNWDFGAKEEAEPETEAPAPETAAPAPETEAPAPETAAPAPETAAPAPETEAPAPETAAPAPETEASVPETEAPAPETEAPAPETLAPEPETPAPEPETEAPRRSGLILTPPAPEPETTAEPETEAPLPEPETTAPEPEPETEPEPEPAFAGTSMKLTDLFTLFLTTFGDWTTEDGETIRFRDAGDGSLSFTLIAPDGSETYGNAMVTETEDAILLQMEWDNGFTMEYGLSFHSLRLYQAGTEEAEILFPIFPVG